MDATQNRIVCPSCGKKYIWKEQLAGKRVKCSCGEAFDAPLEQPGAAAEADDLYGFNDEPPAAPVRRSQPVAAAQPLPASLAVQPRIAPAVVHPMPAASPEKVLTYESKRVVREERHAASDQWRLGDLWLLLGMVGLGFACRLIAPHMETAIGGPRLGLTLALVTLGLAFNIILMIGAMKVAAAMADVDFGHPAPAIIKLGFMFVIAASAGAFCASLGKFDTFGVSFGAHVAILLYWILFPLLFKTGLQETMWAVSIIIILQAIVNIGVWKI